MNKPVRQLVPGEKVQPGDVLLDVNGDTQEVSIKSCDYEDRQFLCRLKAAVSLPKKR